MSSIINTRLMTNQKLTKLQEEVTKNAKTEAPFSGEYLYNKETGNYQCIVCGTTLFKSGEEYDSGSGWPSFWDVAQKDSVKLVEDTSLGMIRTEAKCAKCDAHLGHLFTDGPKDKTGMRYCINSASLNFKKEEK